MLGGNVRAPSTPWEGSTVTVAGSTGEAGEGGNS